MKIAILTFHRAFNCGAMLQAWALQTYLERRGHIVEFPDVNSVGWTSGYSRFETRRRGLLSVAAYVFWLYRKLMAVGMSRPWRMAFDRFMRTHLHLSDVTVDRFRECYDCVVVGSDQVWNPKISRDSLRLFLCEDLPDDVRRIGYAISIGDSPHNIDSDLELFRSCIPHFAALSVREGFLSNLFASYFYRNIKEVVDPTLLLDAVDYESLLEETGVPHEPYLLAYFVLGPTKRFAAYARALGKRLGVRVVLACNYRETRVGDPWGMSYGVGPGRLLALIKHAKYVVAASFHGTVFALHYERPFVVLRESQDAVTSRPAALVLRVGLPERVVSLQTPIEESAEKISQPLPGDLGDRVSRLRTPSAQWLDANLVGGGS